MRRLDEIDRKLLVLLRADAREPTSSLARKLGLPRSTVQERLSRLKSNGVITGFTVNLGQDPESNQNRAILFVALDARSLPQVVVALEGYPEVTSCFTVNGAYDLCAFVETPLLEDLDILLDEIVGLPGVVRTMTSIVLSEKFDRRFVGTAGN